MDQPLAHIRYDPDGKEEAEQTVCSHCRQTAAYAAQALASVFLSAAGYLAGLVHDMGKCTKAFQDYLIRHIGARGSVNHTHAGVRLLLERYHSDEQAEDFTNVACELLALASGGHHGLFDCLDDHGRSGFLRRVKNEEISYEEAVRNFYQFCADEQELDQRFRDALAELTPVLEKICCMTDEDSETYDDETSFYCGLLSRLLLSGVIEGDRRDTGAFLNGTNFPKYRDAEDLRELWSGCLDRVEAALGRLSRSSPIDRARRSISDQCRRTADCPGGVYRLNVPTGGGKTLSSLRFALAHAMRNGNQRIIFTSPLLSILEQNAKEIRKYLQDDSLILEHHSNAVQTEESPECLDQRELLTDTWEAPVILTTQVQLLNTLFSGKTTSIRRFHALCGSVIVIDEVQTVPTKMLSLFSLAVNFLSKICGATVVLCSATQPCIEQIEHPLHAPIPDLVPYSPELWQVFRRTAFHPLGDMTLEGIAQFALEHLEKSLLIICNKRAQAERLFRLLDDSGDYRLFQLSASMCVQHRRDVLKQIRASLDSGQRTLCISTQVIEAGVDISFGCVIRLTAGMDSVVQAAGRCNRNGEAGPGVLAPVYLAGERNEKLDKLPDIQLAKKASISLLLAFQKNPERYGHRLDSDEAIRYYYQALYRLMDDHSRDFVWHKGEPSLFSLLSVNHLRESDAPYFFRQSFRLAGSRFQVFEENTTDVIVPYGRGKTLIPELCGERARRDPAYLKQRLNEARPYTVSLYQYQINRLTSEQGLIPLQGGALGLNGHYSEEIGFLIDDPNLDFLGVT